MAGFDFQKKFFAGYSAKQQEQHINKNKFNRMTTEQQEKMSMTAEQHCLEEMRQAKLAEILRRIILKSLFHRGVLDSNSFWHSFWHAQYNNSINDGNQYSNSINDGNRGAGVDNGRTFGRFCLHEKTKTYIKIQKKTKTYTGEKNEKANDSDYHKSKNQINIKDDRKSIKEGHGNKKVMENKQKVFFDKKNFKSAKKKFTKLAKKTISRMTKSIFSIGSISLRLATGSLRAIFFSFWYTWIIFQYPQLPLFLLLRVLENCFNIFGKAASLFVIASLVRYFFIRTFVMAVGANNVEVYGDVIVEVIPGKPNHEVTTGPEALQVLLHLFVGQLCI